MTPQKGGVSNEKFQKHVNTETEPFMDLKLDIDAEQIL